MRAHQMQVDVLAITDHDTTAGLAAAHAFQQTQKRPMWIVNGVELSAAWHNFTLHVVGLGIDIDCPQLQERLAQQQHLRLQRAMKIAEKLEKQGFPPMWEAVKAAAGQGEVTRTHFAKVLVRDHGVKHLQTAFDRYLGKGQCAYVKTDWPSLETIVGWIKEAGGQAILAHPHHYDLSAKWLRRLFAEFRQVGGDAAEIVPLAAGKVKRTFVNELIQQHQLLASVGSDFHAPSRWTELGKQLSIDATVTPIWHDWQFPSMGKEVL